MTNNDLLRYLADKHDLTHRQIAELLSSEYGTVSKKAVDKWIIDERKMSGIAMELLTIKLDDN